MESRFLKLPFQIGQAGGALEIDDLDAHIKDKIIQILFTSPGERVNLPEFGCGIRNYVFEGNNDIMHGTLHYSISKSLNRWLGKEVAINSVKVFSEEETVFVQITYHRLDKRIPETLEVAYKL